MIWFEIWYYGALLVLITTVPVTFECLCEAFNPNESAWNRRGAALWIPFMWVACAVWPLLIVGLVWMLFDMSKEKREASV